MSDPKRADKLDLLFVIDNSASMAASQVALQAQFPWLLETLTHGRRSSDDPRRFAPLTDIHVGFVSSDMGIPGVPNVPGCAEDGDDDGKLQHSPHGESCDPSYPPFLSSRELDDPDKLAQSASCMAGLGTDGCIIQQPLEAAFKALWPTVYRNASGKKVSPNPVSFISVHQDGTLGHGDVPLTQGGNLGFLRTGTASGHSLLAIVVLTDNEDCSVDMTDHLKPLDQLSANNRFKDEPDLLLRCTDHPEYSYDVTQRYYNSLTQLRPTLADSVVFAAIAGVPRELVTADKLPASHDDAATAAFYDGILSDPAMQQRADDERGTGDGRLVPSCIRKSDDASQPLPAYPPRRLVELAKAFGSRGLVQSICQSDLRPAMEAVVDLIAEQVGSACLP